MGQTTDNSTMWILLIACVAFSQIWVPCTATLRQDDTTIDGTTKQDEAANDGKAEFDAKQEQGKIEAAEKRNFGRWRNANWKHTPRNYRNGAKRQWETSGYSDVNNDVIHTLNKRFSGDKIDIPYSTDDKAPYDDEVYLYPDTLVQGYLPSFNDYGGYVMDGDVDADDFDDDIPLMTQKRHASRWNIIHQKLASLSRPSKKDIESIEDTKRMASRWRLIQNKLDQLNGGADKRFAGRWRNQNWRWRQGTSNSASSVNQDSTVDKRNLGRWKNRNWILRRFSPN